MVKPYCRAVAQKKKKEQVHLVHTKKYLTPKLNHENTIILHGQTKELE